MSSFLFCINCILIILAILCGLMNWWFIFCVGGIVISVVSLYQRIPRLIALLIFLLYCSGFLIGVNKVLYFNQSKIPSTFEKCKINFEGTVSKDLLVQENKNVIIVKTEKLRCKEELFVGHIYLRVSIPHYYQNFYHGDRLLISGNFSRVEHFETETGRIFMYDKFLAKDKIVGLVSYATVEYIGSEKTFFQKIFKFKYKIIDSISRSLPSPYDGLVIGMILGVDGSLDENLENDYRRAGLIHIVVLSGFNVTIIAEAIRRLLPFGYKTNLIISLFGIWIFAIMVGASATVIRATIMATIVLLVRGIHEKYSVNHSLWLAAVIMSFYNPWTLGYDPSFHLSFLATCGIVYLSPIIEKWLVKIPDNFELRFTVSGTLATQIFVFPYSAYSMGEISIASFVVNILTVSFVPLIMFCGFLVFVSSMISPATTVIFAWLAWILISYQLMVVQIASKFKYATIPLPPLGVFIILSIYIAIIAWTVWLNVNHSKKEVVV